jgi:hypothetical protein
MAGAAGWCAGSHRRSIGHEHRLTWQAGMLAFRIIFVWQQGAAMSHRGENIRRWADQIHLVGALLAVWANLV